MHVNLKNRDAAYAATLAWHFFLMGALTVRRQVWDAVAPLPEELRFMADTPIQAAAMAMGTLILDQSLFYYRHHARNLYAMDSSHLASLRRKYDMADATYSCVYRMLTRMKVPEDVVFELLGAIWAEVRRSRLIRFGGTRREALQTEIQTFRANHRNAGIPYRLVNYLTIGAGTLFLRPQRFYQLRDWFAGKGSPKSSSQSE
jgi:hypothetical protein